MILSIIVPIYNVEKYLSRCIDSLINQDINEYDHEIILVNDGSTDSSLSIAEFYAQKHPQIKTINQKNKGVSAARNIGLKNSLGEYIYYIDPDDYVEKNVFKSLINIILNHQLDFLGFNYTTTAASNFKIDIKPQDILKYDTTLKISNGCSFISECNYYNTVWWYIFKRELVTNNNIKFVNGIMVEDGIYTTELLLNCKRATYLPVSIYRYFENTNSIMRNKSTSHIKRLNNDYKLVIMKFSNLIDMAKEYGANKKALKRLKARQQSYLFFLIVRLLKANTSNKDIQSLIKGFKLNKIYPLNNFVGTDYNSNKIRILTSIFNKPVLLSALILVNKKFKFIK